MSATDSELDLAYAEIKRLSSIIDTYVDVCAASAKEISDMKNRIASLSKLLKDHGVDSPA